MCNEHLWEKKRSYVEIDDRKVNKLTVSKHAYSCLFESKRGGDRVDQVLPLNQKKKESITDSNATNH